MDDEVNKPSWEAEFADLVGELSAAQSELLHYSDGEASTLD